MYLQAVIIAVSNLDWLVHGDKVERLVRQLARHSINLPLRWLVESLVAFNTVTVEHTLRCSPVSKVPRVAWVRVLVFCCTLRFMANWWLGLSGLDTLPSWRRFVTELRCTIMKDNLPFLLLLHIAMCYSSKLLFTAANRRQARWLPSYGICCIIWLALNRIIEQESRQYIWLRRPCCLWVMYNITNV